jgi:hypothetical protein
MYLERYSRARGRIVYEQIGVVTQQDVEDLLSIARQLRTEVIKWLRATRPELVPPGL